MPRVLQNDQGLPIFLETDSAERKRSYFVAAATCFLYAFEINDTKLDQRGLEAVGGLHKMSFFATLDLVLNLTHVSRNRVVALL